MWVAKCSASNVVSASVDNELLLNPPLLICPPLAAIVINDSAIHKTIIYIAKIKGKK